MLAMRCLGEGRKEFRCLKINVSSCHQLDMGAERFHLSCSSKDREERWCLEPSPLFAPGVWVVGEKLYFKDLEKLALIGSRMREGAPNSSLREAMLSGLR